jgi:hypothetical protein
MLSIFACEAAGASCARHSLRPLNFRWLYTMQNSRGIRAARSRRCVALCVVPANAGTHNHSLGARAKSSNSLFQSQRRRVWVPAFAGTTSSGGSAIENAAVYVNSPCVFARSEATKQSSLLVWCVGSMDCFACARNDKLQHLAFRNSNGWCGVFSS